MNSNQARTVPHTLRLVLSLAIVLLLLMSLLYLVAPPGGVKAQVTQYTVEAFSAGGGTVTPSSQLVNEGETATLNITPDTGNYILTIKDNDVSQAVANPYLIVDVREYHKVVVNFANSGYEGWHPYKSSIDGTTLPCSISKPSAPADPTKIPLWVDLHAFGGQGDGIPTINDKFVLSPWGRNYKSMYCDAKDAASAPEPSIFDDFSSTAAGWTALNGTWSATGGSYQQTDTGAYWKASDRASSNGSDYTVTADLKESQRVGGESAMGILFRKQGAGNTNCYWLDLDNSGGSIFLRLFRYQGGGWTPLSIEPVMHSVPDPANPGQYISVQYTENDDWWKNGVNLKVNMFETAIEVRVNDYLTSLDPGLVYHTDDSWGGRIKDTNFTSGGVALASFGGVHKFDNVRVQNDFLFGETDVIDCINQFIEEFSTDPNYRVDPTRIYLSGYSMGAVGTWSVGMHYPDLFTALHPSQGASDMLEGYNWIKTHYPDNPPPIWPLPWLQILFKGEQDAYIGDTIDAILDGNPNNTGDPNYTLMRSSLHESSARYVMENALNTSMRIQHVRYDSLIPNVTTPYATNPGPDVYIYLTDSNFFNWLNPPGLNNFWNTEVVPANTVFAQADNVWQKWYPGAVVPSGGVPSNGLSKCKQETSGYGEDGAIPSDPNLRWDDSVSNYSQNFAFGAHGIFWPILGYQWDDRDFPAKIESFFDRAQNNYGALRKDPPDVAYKSFDTKHNSAWWLNMEVAYPDQDKPGLARISNGRKKSTPYNGAEVHVKNVKTTSLDLTRMGIDTTNSSTTATKALTFKIDKNTTPEGEPVTDTWNKTTLKLSGIWFPASWSSYSVKLGSTDLKSSSSMTGSVLTITDVPVTTTQTTLTVTVPKNVTNMLSAVNPGFESGETNWTKGKHYGPIDGTGTGTGTFAVDTVEQAHTGTTSARIKDAKGNTTPFVSSWLSKEVAVSGSTTYSASAFVKTRALLSKTRVYANGKYDPNTNAKAGVGILWLNSSKVPVRLDTMASGEVNGSKDWSTVELRLASPSTARYAKVIVYSKSPDASGASGSAWFDDVALRQ